MLRRYTTVVFAVLGLLLFDWEDPSPEDTFVLDAFDGIAEIMDSRESDPSKEQPVVDTAVRYALQADVTYRGDMPL
jgi:hypothetical protein